MSPLTNEAREQLYKIMSEHGLTFTLAAIGSRCDLLAVEAANWGENGQCEFWRTQGTKIYLFGDSIQTAEILAFSGEKKAG